MTAVLNDIQNDSSVKAAVLISGKPGCFIAGADITMLENLKTADEVSAVSRTGMVFYSKNMYNNIF